MAVSRIRAEQTQCVESGRTPDSTPDSHYMAKSAKRTGQLRRTGARAHWDRPANGRRALSIQRRPKAHPSPRRARARAPPRPAALARDHVGHRCAKASQHTFVGRCFAARFWLAPRASGCLEVEVKRVGACGSSRSRPGSASVPQTPCLKHTTLGMRGQARRRSAFIYRKANHAVHDLYHTSYELAVRAAQNSQKISVYTEAGDGLSTPAAYHARPQSWPTGEAAHPAAWPPIAIAIALAPRRRRRTRTGVHRRPRHGPRRSRHVWSWHALGKRNVMALCIAGSAHLHDIPGQGCRARTAGSLTSQTRLGIEQH